MKKVIGNEMFCAGLNVGICVGICLYQQEVIDAHSRKEPLKIGDTLYYLQDGRERLAEVLEKMCK